MMEIVILCAIPKFNTTIEALYVCIYHFRNAIHQSDNREGTLWVDNTSARSGKDPPQCNPTSAKQRDGCDGRNIGNKYPVLSYARSDLR